MSGGPHLSLVDVFVELSWEERIYPPAFAQSHHSGVPQHHDNIGKQGMASLPEQHTLELSEGSGSLLPIKTKCTATKIDGIHTEIILNEYRNRVFIILSQYGKLGSLITVEKETSRNTNGCSEVYQVRTILGGENTSYHIAARYLTEETRIIKPALFSISMKNCDLSALKTIKDIIERNKSW